MHVLICLASFSLWAALLAEQPPKAPAFQDRTEFYEISKGVEDSSFVIRYWVRFDGLVEFSLYDAKDRRMGYYSVVRTQGDYAISMPLDKLPTYERLSYMFRYKNKEYTGSFVVPGS